MLDDGIDIFIRANNAYTQTCGVCTRCITQHVQHVGGAHTMRCVVVVESVLFSGACTRVVTITLKC